MGFDRLSIQSKLVLMLLSVSIGSILAIGVVGYLDGERRTRGSGTARWEAGMPPREGFLF